MMKTNNKNRLFEVMSKVDDKFKSPLNEELDESQYGSILRLREIVDIVSRMGLDKETIQIMFVRVYKHSGDEGVVDLFNAITGHNISVEGRGQYRMEE